MSKDNVISFEKPGAIVDLLTEFLQEGAQKLLRQAVELELEEWLAQYKDFKNAQGRRINMTPNKINKT